MSFLDNSYLYGIFIEQHGEAVEIIKRTETIDESGMAVFTDGRTIDTMAWMRDIGGYIDIFDSPGFYEGVDVSALFEATADIDDGDLVVKKHNYEKYLVKSHVKRRIGRDPEYLEVLLVKVN